MISVLTPTSIARHWAHATLYACFVNQRGCAKRELLVLDDGGVKSPFFTSLRDKRVRYFHAPVLPPRVRSVGAKRNFLAGKARGAILAAFDDDDVYADDYLSRMARALLASSADLVTLSSWLGYDAGADELRWYEAEADGELGHHARAWGYGFSYVYTAALAARVPFPSLDHGEDYALVLLASQQGGACLAFRDSTNY